MFGLIIWQMNIKLEEEKEYKVGLMKLKFNLKLI
jgi:hypothetical protein